MDRDTTLLEAIMDAQAELQVGLGFYRLDHGRGTLVDDRLSKSLALLHRLLHQLGMPMYQAATHPEVEPLRLVTTPFDDPIVHACVEHGGHFWPEDGPEDEPKTCVRCWFNPGWKGGKVASAADIRPVRDEPQA